MADWRGIYSSNTLNWPLETRLAKAMSIGSSDGHTRENFGGNTGENFGGNTGENFGAYSHVD